ncbi:MAG: hypothetical protein KDA24_08410 [Deltaproteobacteria bacterium]|nr:hypothetical protein [Deltaproteobacteria bacterium]
MHHRLLLPLLLAVLLGPSAAFATGMNLPGPDPAKFHLPPPVHAPTGADVTVAMELEAPRSSQADLSVEERRAIQKRLKVRRTMADVHQVMAFTSAGLIIAAEVIGTINFAALEEGDPPYRDLKPSLALHRVLAGAAIGTYWTTGAISWAMPPAYKANVASAPGKKKKADSGDAHVALSVAHGIGMGTMMITGALLANAADNKAWEPLMVTHLAVGYATAAMVIGAGIVINTL